MKFNITKFRPCDDGKEFYDSCTSFKNMWETCPRGDWLLWISSKLNVDKRVLSLAKGKCAETVIHLMKDERSRNAVQAAIDYGNGLIDEEQLYAAANAADDAAVASADTLAADDAAANAAANAASNAAAYAAAANAADVAALKENHILTANICREILTDAVFKILNGRESDEDE